MKSILRPRQEAQSVHAVAFNFDDMTEKAKAYLATVQADAQKIVSDAQRQGDAIRKQAAHEGRAAALAEVDRIAEQKVAAQVKTLLPALQKAIKQIEESRAAWQKHWQQQAVHLAAAIAQRIIRRELTHDPDITLALIREALELAAGSAEVRIFLNPDDHRTLGQQARLLIDELSHTGSAEVITSPDITPGGCQVETKFGLIDQRIEVQLARIENELT